ncbi:polyphosphate kinase 2, partial [Vibrio vulnificus]|nr:polyphosphate kinase 2 [Vibrio vulnificus]
DYRNVEYPPVTLPVLNQEGYVRAPVDEQTFVPFTY